MFTTDAAADELKLSRMLSEKYFPSLSVRFRDRAHAISRLTRKNWNVDPYLAKTFGFFIRNKGSFVSTVWHSPAIKRTFHKYVPCLSLTVKNMSITDCLSLSLFLTLH